MKFYTSDLHLDHSNMLGYDNRPWEDVEKMNEGIIARINGRVAPDDELYILGDFTLRTKHTRIEEMRKWIICKHVHLVAGNHDYFALNPWAKDLFESVSHYKEIYDNDRKIILCHYPIMWWNGMTKGSYHLYGHIHTRPNMAHPHPRAFNVGIDANGYYPRTLDELIQQREIWQNAKKGRYKNV